MKSTISPVTPPIVSIVTGKEFTIISSFSANSFANSAIVMIIRNTRKNPAENFPKDCGLRFKIKFDFSVDLKIVFAIIFNSCLFC